MRERFEVMSPRVDMAEEGGQERQGHEAWREEKYCQPQRGTGREKKLEKSLKAYRKENQ